LRVQLANQVLGYLRQWALVLSEKDLKDEAARSKWRSQLPRSKTVSVQLQALLKSHDLRPNRSKTCAARSPAWPRPSP